MKFRIPAVLAVAALLYSCREEEHPVPSFLPCAQITFVDSIVEIDLQMVELEITALLRATVQSPVGLAAVQLGQVNKLGNNMVDTVLVQEITTFDNNASWSINGSFPLAGYTKGISIKAIDGLGQVSQRVLPVTLFNSKLRPTITWLNADGSANTTYTADGITVKRYGSYVVSPLKVKIESWNGNEWSWGLDKLSTYLVYEDGTQALVVDASRDLSADPCAGCRNSYEFNFTPDYANTVKQLRLVATDLKMQQTESYINVKVYENIPAPLIMYTQSKLTVDDNDPTQAVVEFDVASEDSRFSRFVYYLLRADGSADSIGIKTSGFPDIPSGSVYKQHVRYVLPTIENVAGFRIKVVNRDNIAAEQDLPVEVAPGVEGVKHLRNMVAFTYEDRLTRSYVYSVASNRFYMDGEAGAASVGVADTDIVFRSDNHAYIYLDAPINNGSSNWKGDKTRKTFFLKLTTSYGIDFETVTRAQLLTLDSVVARYGEITVSAANRPRQSLIGLVKSTVVDSKGRLLSVEESIGVVDQAPGTWALVRMTHPNLDPYPTEYVASATREEAALDITYAFRTQDGIVGLLKITEGLAYRPGVKANAITLQRQRVTFSIKTAEQPHEAD
jgi:hypothetical protein